LGTRRALDGGAVATELTSSRSDIHPEGLRRSLERLRWGMDTKARVAERLSWPSVDLQW
jgi:hypothetical protein